MGIRFRKSIKIAPGVRLNIGKKSTGISIGGKYGGISMNSKTGMRARVSAPGTGLSYSTKIEERENAVKENREINNPVTPILKPDDSSERVSPPETFEGKKNGIAKFMSKLSKRDRWIIGILILVIYAASAEWPYPLSYYGGIVLAIVFSLFLIFSIIYKVPDKAAEERARMAAAKHARDEDERRNQQLKQEEFEKTHGKIITKVTGVTFKNEDNTSRQAYLKEAFINDSIGTVGFEVYEHGDGPAVHVLFDGMCIGNLPKPVVGQFLEVKDRIDSAHIFVNRFSPDDFDESNRRKEIIYRADLFITYKLINDD